MRHALGMGPTLPPNLLIAAMRADVSKYLEVPLESEAVVSMLGRLNLQPGAPPETEPAPQRQRGRILHLFSPKGGSGATTVTVNLAIALAKERAGRILIVDLRNDYASVIQSVNTGNPVREASPFTRDVRRLAKKLIGAQGAGAEVEAGRDGTLLQRAVRGSLRTVLSF